ncbi:MAG: outer membrane lipoprotein-sorting protein [Acidobacteriota bacterium]
MSLNLKLSHADRRITQLAVCAVLFLSLAVCNGCKRETSSSSGDNEKVRQERGAQIVADYLKHDAAPYRKNRVRLTIAAPSEPVKVYELEIWRKQTPEETLTLTHVVQPADESDLAALSVERKGQPSINVTYVSSTDQFRETGTNKMFFGGLTAQELLGEWNKYDYQLLNEKNLDGVKVYEVEGTLKPSGDSIIARTRTLFRADTYLPAEMHLLSSDGSELRTFKVKKFRNVAGREVIWLTEIDNHSRQTKITIESLSLDFPEKADDSIFTRDRLKQIAQRKS